MKKETILFIQKILGRSIWILLGIGTIILLASAINNKSLMICRKVDISISGAHNNIFIDESDVEKILENINEGTLIGKPVKYFDLAMMEDNLAKNDWIRKAEIFFDNNEVLQVNILEREPVARILTQSGESFYIDANTFKIPLSPKFSARLPIFTGFNDTSTSKSDTALLIGIKNISQYILKDSFWMAQIDQVAITKDQLFEMVPKIGNQLIEFGTADRYMEKFHYLFLFYKKVLSKVGWNRYSKINVEYSGQIISIKRGAGEIKMDSLKTAEIMKSILLKAQIQMADSSEVQLGQKDDLSQQIIPLVNIDLPNENLTILDKQKFQFANNIGVFPKKDTLKNRFPIKEDTAGFPLTVSKSYAQKQLHQYDSSYKVKTEKNAINNKKKKNSKPIIDDY